MSAQNTFSRIKHILPNHIFKCQMLASPFLKHEFLLPTDSSSIFVDILFFAAREWKIPRVRNVITLRSLFTLIPVVLVIMSVMSGRRSRLHFPTRLLL